MHPPMPTKGKRTGHWTFRRARATHRPPLPPTKPKNLQQRTSDIRQSVMTQPLAGQAHLPQAPSVAGRRERQLGRGLPWPAAARLLQATSRASCCCSRQLRSCCDPGYVVATCDCGRHFPLPVPPGRELGYMSDSGRRAAAFQHLSACLLSPMQLAFTQPEAGCDTFPARPPVAHNSP
jgi:hypothetical protein